jgi:hypothetical protein
MTGEMKMALMAMPPMMQRRTVDKILTALALQGVMAPVKVLIERYMSV